MVAHELGHFVTARWFGMRVHEFGVGFPPRLLGFYRDPVTKKIVWVGRKAAAEQPATIYSLNWLPLGGFCKIKGESGEEGAAPDSFAHKKAWQRIIVLVAGVVMNILLAAVLLGIGFMVGIPSDVSQGVDRYGTVIGEPRVMIQQVVKDSPADKAGFQLGDKILTIENKNIQRGEELVAAVRAAGTKPVKISFERDGTTQTIEVTPVVSAEDNIPRLGILMADAALVQYPWWIAIWKGVIAALQGFIAIFISFYILIKNLILGQGLAFEVSGPVGIASLVGQSAQLGISYLINVAAMISLSLAAMNILPIPALDGGRAFFVIIEKIMRRPVPMRYEQVAHTIGFILLMILILVVTGRDILGLIK